MSGPPDGEAGACVRDGQTTRGNGTVVVVVEVVVDVVVVVELSGGTVVVTTGTLVDGDGAAGARGGTTGPAGGRHAEVTATSTSSPNAPLETFPMELLTADRPPALMGRTVQRSGSIGGGLGRAAH